VKNMKRLGETSDPMAWLEDRPSEEAVTAFDAIGWPASTWVLPSTRTRTWPVWEPTMTCIGGGSTRVTSRHSSLATSMWMRPPRSPGTSLGFVVRPGRTLGQNDLGRVPAAVP